MIRIDDLSRVAKNTVFLNIATIITRGLSFVTSIVIARYLGKSEFGQYTFASYFAGLFVILTDVGLGYLTVREVARDRAIADKYLGYNLIIRTAFGVVTFAVISLAVNIMGYPPVVRIAVYILASYTILKCLGSSFSSIFMAFERMWFIALLDVLLTSAILGGVLVGISLKYDFIKLLWVYPAAITAYICLSFMLLAGNGVKPAFAFKFAFARNLVKNSLPFALSSIFLVVFTNIDTVMLKSISGDIPTGYYGVSRALISALVFIPANFNTVLYPVFSRCYQSSKDSLIKYYEKSFQLLLILALPIAVGGTILAERIIVLVYGQEYSPAAPCLRILVWALAIQFVNSDLTILMLAANRQKTVAMVTFVGMVLNIVLNSILIPRFSYIGVSVATTICYAAVFIMSWCIISRSIHRLNLVKVITKPALAALLMGVFAYLLRDANVFLIIAMSAAFYLFMLCVLRVIRRSDIDLCRQLFKSDIRPE